MFGFKVLIQSAFLIVGYSSEIKGDIMPHMVGGEYDSNNCLVGAGYSWCESSQSCIRQWEDPCQDNFNDCPDCFKRQRKGENIACPVECDFQQPIPEHIYDPIRDLIRDPTVLPNPGIVNICPEVMCMMYCENDFQKDDNGCGTCSCNEVRNPECPIPYEDCDNDYVCPKVLEITHCSEGGINDYTTYQLSLIVKDNQISNLYAIFGSSESGGEMIIPPSYQVNSVFGSNLGGVSDQFIALDPDSEFDSWLTIGITDGDPNNKLATIGIDFSTWDSETSLTVGDGAVFLMDPEEVYIQNNEVIIGQLTIPSEITAEVIINVQGKIIGTSDFWQEVGIHFTLNSPVRNVIDRIPEDCVLWFDGCNSCLVVNGEMTSCTRMMCFTEDTPYCLRIESGH